MGMQYTVSSGKPLWSAGRLHYRVRRCAAMPRLTHATLNWLHTSGIRSLLLRLTHKQQSLPKVPTCYTTVWRMQGLVHMMCRVTTGFKSSMLTPSPSYLTREAAQGPCTGLKGQNVLSHVQSIFSTEDPKYLQHCRNSRQVVHVESIMDMPVPELLLARTRRAAGEPGLPLCRGGESSRGGCLPGRGPGHAQCGRRYCGRAAGTHLLAQYETVPSMTLTQ